MMRHSCNVGQIIVFRDNYKRFVIVEFFRSPKTLCPVNFLAYIYHY